MHIAFGIFVVDTIQNLSIRNRTEGCNGHNLSLSTGEQCRTMYTRNEPYLTSQRTDFINAAAIYTFTFIQQPSSYNKFLEFIDAFIDLCTLFWVLLIEFCMDFFDYWSQTLFTDVLVVGIQCIFYFINCEVLDCLEHVVVNFLRLKAEFWFADFSLYVSDELCNLLDFFVCFCNCFQHGVFFDLICTSFDHNDLFAGTCNGQLKIRFLSLLFIWADDDLIINQTYLNTADWTIPWNIGNGQCKGSTEHAGNFWGVILINRENGHNNRNVVSHIFWEERTDWTVYQTGSQDCFLGWTALTFNEGTWDFTNCVQFFLKINRQREEINALTWFWCSSNVYHNGGIAVAYQNGTVCQTSHFAGFEGNFLSGKLCFKYSEIFKHSCSLL